VEREPKKVQIFLAVTISFFLLVFSGYLYYHNLGETNFFSADLSFENPDQENALVDQQKEFRVSVLNFFSFPFLPEASLFEQFLGFSYQIPSLERQRLVIRC